MGKIEVAAEMSGGVEFGGDDGGSRGIASWVMWWWQGTWGFF